MSGLEKQISGRLISHQCRYTPRRCRSRFVCAAHYLAVYIFAPTAAIFRIPNLHWVTTCLTVARSIYLPIIAAAMVNVWKENILSEHQLNLINISSVQPAHITTDFQDSLKLQPKFYTLKRSIEKQFIIGSTYNYNFNTANKPNSPQKK